MIRPTTLVFALAALATTTAAQAVMPITVSLESEKPGLQESTSGFDAFGIERFEGQKPGEGQVFKTDFGSKGEIYGKYSNIQINEQDQYGGANGKGNYAVTFSSKGYSLDLGTSLENGISYFGFWLSALDGGNNVTFFQKDEKLFTFAASDAQKFIKGLKNSDQYFCNPNGNFKGDNCGEPYAFLNFYAAKGTSFDRIVFTQSPEGGGYESDNHSVGRWNKISGLIIPAANAVPEPETWTLLIAGFSMVGFAARRRSRFVPA